MFEKVNPKHPDKIMDVIAGALVDLAYTKSDNPKIAVEGVIGHGRAYVVIETSEDITKKEVCRIVRKYGRCDAKVQIVKQDPILNKNQSNGLKCGDNGIFKGVPVSQEEKDLVKIAKAIYEQFDCDGKYILDGDKLIICQSNATETEIKEVLGNFKIYSTIINPLGYWKGGTNVDTGAVNRKLGSDMGRSVTGGGLHGKDLSKADVSVNIYAHLKAQALNQPVEISCAIGDEYIDGHPYAEVVEMARSYIKKVGGFAKFAEWGLLNGED